MNDSSFASWPNFSDEEANAVRDVVQSNRVNYWTGQIGREFEKDFAKWTGSAHAIALTNGTVALDLALKALDIGEGDEVIVTPRTFIASVSCVVTAGATPVFADVDPDSGNITPDAICAAISDRTRAIIPVHLAGWPCDMPKIMDIARQNNLYVIEDCAQAHGASVGGQMVGSLGDIGAWSFCQDKIMTTGGEGGMTTTNRPDLWEKMWSYKDHGKSWDAVYNRAHPPGFRWLSESFGTNWRMLEMQAAIGLIQLRQMSQWTNLRTRNAKALQSVLRAFPQAIRVPEPPDGHNHAYYRFYGYVRPEGLKSGWTRDRIVQEVSDLGYPAFQGSCSEVYLEKAFEGTGWTPQERLPVARELGETSVMLLVHPSIEEEQLRGYCDAVQTVMQNAVR
ncbi:MAG: DegT/DnrJ/EryC1/StrS aminotransferase family protein [Pseudomonadota bacterium]